MLHVGDTVLAVQGQPLNGERVATALNADKLASYDLTVARSTASGAAAKQVGEFQGWVYVLKAKDGQPLATKSGAARRYARRPSPLFPHPVANDAEEGFGT